MYSRDSAFLQNSSSRSQSSIVQNLLDSFHNEYMDSEPNPKPTPSSTAYKSDETSKNLLNFSHKLEMEKAKYEFLDEKRLSEKREKELEDRNISLVSTINELEEKNNKLKKENSDLLRKSFRLNEKSVEESNKKDVMIEKLKRELFQLQNSKEAAIIDLQSKLTIEENTRRSLSDNRDFLKSELTLMKLKYQQTDTINKKYKENEETLTGMKRENDELKNNLSISEKIIKDLNSKLEEMKQTQQMMDAFHDNRKKLRNLEEVNKKLNEQLSSIKEKNENVFLLKERNYALESQLERFRVRCEDHDELKSENELLSKQLKQLQANHNNRATADVLKIELNRSDEKNRELMKKVNKIRHHLSSSEADKIRLQNEVTSLKTQIQTKTASFRSFEKNKLDMETRLKITTDERDNLQNLLKTYETDPTSTNQLQRRCRSLQDTNIELQKKLDVYKMQTNEVPTQKSCTSCISLQEEKDNLQREFEDFKKRSENKYGEGYNPNSTQVLHFRMNPVDVAVESHQKKFEEIQLENKRLKQKLKEMQTGHEVSMSEIEFSQTAKKQIELAQLREEQLSETYSKIIEQLRQVIYCLFGYMILNGSVERQYKLISMYAENKDDYLLVEIDQDGEVNLLESNFSKQVASLIDLHLHHQKSFPMFISAVTQELFSDQTILN